MATIRGKSIWGGLARFGTPGRSGFGGFTPYTPPAPPAGSYDPSLDAQGRAALRGLGDLGYDVGTQNTRDTVDYGFNRGQTELGRTRGLEDIGTQRAALEQQYGRNMADLGSARSRGTEDHSRAVQTLVQGYQRLGNTQAQQMRSTGVSQGGAALQAAAKRKANEAQDQQPIDTNFNRFLSDNSQAQTRLGEDRSTGLGALDTATSRLNTDTDTSLGRLALLSAPPDASSPLGGRAFQDRTLESVRAGREYNAFSQDLGQQKLYQAMQAGYVPPARGQPGGIPSNEFTDPNGNPYRVVTRGNTGYHIGAAGNTLSKYRRR